MTKMSVLLAFSLHDEKGNPLDYKKQHSAMQKLHGRSTFVLWLLTWTLRKHNHTSFELEGAMLLTTLQIKLQEISIASVSCRGDEPFVLNTRTFYLSLSRSCNTSLAHHQYFFAGIHYQHNSPAEKDHYLILEGLCLLQCNELGQVVSRARRTRVLLQGLWKAFQR